jgi:hypothetical protein
MYLESIFAASEDIKKMLPTESALFDSVNSSYGAITGRVAANKNALAACAFPNYLQDLEEMDEKLERIQKALDQYLENKRQQFPRFYFVSNDDLLEILGQAKNPTVILSHLKKLFAGISKVNFSPANDQIVAMCSLAGEEVLLYKPVLVTEQVEAWLQQLTVAMKATLQGMIQRAISSGETDIERLPLQVLCIAQYVAFTRECEAVTTAEIAVVEIQRGFGGGKDQLVEFECLGRGTDTVVLFQQRAVDLEMAGRDVVDQHFAEPVEFGLRLSGRMLRAAAQGIGEGAEAGREILALEQPPPVHLTVWG